MNVCAPNWRWMAAALACLTTCTNAASLVPELEGGLAGRHAASRCCADVRLEGDVVVAAPLSGAYRSH